MNRSQHSVTLFQKVNNELWVIKVKNILGKIWTNPAIGLHF